MRRRKPPILILALFALLAAAQLLPAEAHASRSQESLFQDDANLLYSSPSRRDKTLNELDSLGVDVIRANVVWNKYAPSPTHKKKPSFNDSDPNAYPLGQVDGLVNAAQQRGISVLLTPTVPGPAWASSCKGSVSSRRICRPRPSLFGHFVTALGRRYPQVHRWSIMNEPNLGAWLTPQYSNGGLPTSPTIYRNLVRAATSALSGSGHGGDQILLGETAPIGRTSGARYKRSIGPATFYRELFCLNARGRRLGGHAAKVRGCKNYKRLAVTGVAHHPYTAGAGRSPNARVGKADITLRYISRLSLWMNRGAKAHRIKGGLPIYLTEYGFQTDPPDRFAGTSLRNQAKWLNQSDFVAWRYHRINSVAQYELRDERARAAFQTGLRFVNGKAKPALAAYRLPIWPIQGRRGTKIWLQVRPAAQLGVPQKITIQFRTKGGKKFRTLKSVNVTAARGFLYTSTKRKARYWRFLWKGHASRTASP
jgi:hypothetical protein